MPANGPTRSACRPRAACRGASSPSSPARSASASTRRRSTRTATACAASRVCQEISNEFELHAFNNRTNVRSVIRRDYRGDVVRSNRLRTPEERTCWRTEGAKIAVIEAQGALFFGSTEQLLRRIAELDGEAHYVIVDFKRVHLADTSARKLIMRAGALDARRRNRAAVRRYRRRRAARRRLSRELAEHEAERLVRVFRDADAALEWCEDQLLARSPARRGRAQIRALRARRVQGPERPRSTGWSRPSCGRSSSTRARSSSARATRRSCSSCSRAARVSVQIRVPTQTGERKRRVASIGPGSPSARWRCSTAASARPTSIADERVVCYGLAVEQLQELAAEHPNIMITILGNLTRDFSERLRHANEEIRTLE